MRTCPQMIDALRREEGVIPGALPVCWLTEAIPLVKHTVDSKMIPTLFFDNLQTLY